MLLKRHYILILLAFIGTFSTVTAVSASSADVVKISNVVQSTSRTGGSAGVDGQDGHSGASSQAGASVVNIQPGNGVSSVHVESVINGETVIDLHQVTDESVTATASLAVNSSTTVPVVATSVTTTRPQSESLSKLQNLLESLQLMIISYVSHLF